MGIVFKKEFYENNHHNKDEYFERWTLKISGNEADQWPFIIDFIILIFLLLRRGVKKRIFYGRADRKHLTPPPLRSAFSEFFWVYFWLHIMTICMCSEMGFSPEKSFSSTYKNFQLLLTAAAAFSQNGQIENWQREPQMSPGGAGSPV